MTIRAAGYVRVSDESQVDGHSLGAQRSEIERWCNREGHDLVEIYEDPGVSAYTDDISKRPAFSRLLADAEAGKLDLVVVHTIDRWARNVAVQALSLTRLGDAKVGFASVMETGIDFTTPAGRLILSMLGGAHEFFSAQAGVHVRKAQRRRFELGLSVGPVPFGYRPSAPGALPEPVAREMGAIRSTFQDRADGVSYGTIATRLNHDGFRTRTDRIFTPHAVRDLIANAFYRGDVSYRGETRRGQHEPLVSSELFQRVQARRTRAPVRTVRGPRPLLQGHSFCLRCGHGLQSDRHRGRTPMYRERHAGGCDTNNTASISAPIDDQIGAIIESIHLPADWQQRMTAVAAGERPRVDVAKLQDKRRRLARAFADGGFSESEYTTRLAEIDRTIADATPTTPVAVEDVAALFADVKQLWAEATPAERRTLIEPLIERAYIDLQEKMIGAITPVPAFATLLEHAIEQSCRSSVVLIGPDELERQQCWSWWRRGRIELPVQSIRARPYYVCSRSMCSRPRPCRTTGQDARQPELSFRAGPSTPAQALGHYGVDPCPSEGGLESTSPLS